MKPSPPISRPNPPSAQTLLRGLDVLEAIAEQPLALNELAVRAGLTRMTTWRLAAALINRGLVRFTPTQGYRLGPKLLEFGFKAQQQSSLIGIARPMLEELSRSTGDTVHLGMLHGKSVLYLDKIPGSRRLAIGSRIGECQPLCSTALGKALLLDSTEDEWERLFHTSARGPGGKPVSFPAWAGRMKQYVSAGCTFDLEENEDRIRCVAVPVRDKNGSILAAISVSAAAQYMDDGRMDELSFQLAEAAVALGCRLGQALKIC